MTPSLEPMVRAAFPRARLLHAEALTGGFRNTNIKVCLDAPAHPVVLRIYRHDPSLCRKELDLLALLRSSVPVPEVLYADSAAHPPFAFLRYVEGLTFLALKRSGDREAIAQAAGSAGETLAAIAAVRFPQCGWLDPGPTVGAPLLEGPDPYPRFIEQRLARSPVPADLRRRVVSLGWSHAADYTALDADPRLVHGDFSRRNLIVRRDHDRWQVAAVLDWEFAVSASPLADFGSFLRYDPIAAPRAEPHFSAAYRAAGGRLPEDWRRLARLLDLAAMAECLTHADLPTDALQELIELLSRPL